MKRLFNICFCICLSFAVSCSQDAPVDENVLPVENQKDPAENPAFVLFEGKGEVKIAFDGYAEDATRAVKHEWENGDQLFIYSQSSPYHTCIGYFIMEEGEWNLLGSEALMSESQTLNINSYYGENASSDYDSNYEIILHLDNAPFCVGTGILDINIDTETGVSSYYADFHFRQFSTRIRVSGVPEGETASLEGISYPYTVSLDQISYYNLNALKAKGDEENNAYFYVSDLTEGTQITFRTETGGKEFLRTIPRTIENASAVTFAMPTPESHDGWTMQDNQMKFKQIYFTTTDGEPITPNDIENNKLVSTEYYKDGFLLTYANPVTELSYAFFNSASTLQSITLPASLEIIGWDCFSGCSSLTSIIIPDAITEIGGGAFSGCTSLSSVTMPGLTEGKHFEYSFSGCPIETITITSNAVPNSLCQDITSTLKNVTLNEGVTGIGEYAFSRCSGLTEITIPSTVTEIGGYAFGGCTGLKTVTLNEGVTAIGELAFAYCSGLTEIAIPSTVTNIGDGAFGYCSELKTVTLNEGVTAIGGSAFAGCSGLTEIALPSTVTKIGGYAFAYCSGLTSVTIPDAITEIGGSVFEECTSLSSVTMPGVTEGRYWESLFVNCPIETITITSNAVPGSLCQDITSTLKNVTLNEGVTGIEGSAFSGCSGLTEITLPSTVTKIGDRAFENCSGLTSVTIPNTVTELGYNVFMGCTSITSVTTPGYGNIDYLAGCPVEEIIFTSGSVGGFYNRTTLPSITLKEGVTDIAGNAFTDCTALTEIALPSTVKRIGGYAFSGTSLTTLTLPKGIETVGIGAFSKTQLTEIDLPDGITELYETFKNCTALKSVKLPKNLTNLGGWTFSGCSALTEIELPTQLETIGEEAFYGTRIAAITLPATLKSIGSKTFNYCRLLKSVTCLAVTPPAIVTDTFSESFTGPVYVPAESIPAYQSDDNWSWFTFEALP